MDNLFVPNSLGVIKYDTVKNIIISAAPKMEHDDVLAMRAAMVNMIDDHMESYASDIGKLVAASDAAKRRIRPGPVLISPDAAMSLLNTASQRAERFYDRFGNFDWTRISVVMPYAIVALDKDGEIDLVASNPYVNGVLIVGWKM